MLTSFRDQFYILSNIYRPLTLSHPLDGFWVRLYFPVSSSILNLDFLEIYNLVYLSGLKKFYDNTLV